MLSRVNYGGLVVAGTGFLLTRFTVTLAIYDDPVRFYLAGVVPLGLGLGLAAFGVALAVADVEASLVRTTALWCVAGAGTMLVLVVLTLLGSTTGDVVGFGTVRSRAYLSNFLIGGSVGGTLTGLYAAANRRQRETLLRQTNRLRVLNRMLRHEVLNSVTVIRGYAGLDPDENPGAREVIEDRSDAIRRAVEGVRHLARPDGPGETVDLSAALERSVETVRERYPDADVAVDEVPEGVTVRADDRLHRAFVHLLENGVVHASTAAPSVAVSVHATGSEVAVRVRDEGPGLPAGQRALLEEGAVEEFDDPRAGFGLNVVRLLLESYGGRATVETDEDGTTVTVVLRRGDVPAAGLRRDAADAGVLPAAPQLAVTLGAALVAGVPYAVVAELLGGSVAAIGVFYGIENAVVGWYTHEFHSVVFGFAFAGLASGLPARYRDDVVAYAALGVAWAVCIWVVAAGVVAPVWLRLLGVPAPLPNLSLSLLASHLVWGCSLGALTAWGYRHVAPALRRAEERVRSATDV